MISCRARLVPNLLVAEMNRIVAILPQPFHNPPIHTHVG